MKDNELIEILKEFEIFVDDDYGGSYQSVISYTKDKKISRAFSCFGALKIIDEFEKMQKEKQELINYLKSEDIDLKENVVNLEEKLRNTPRDSFYYNSYLKTLHSFRAKRELIKEILSKIEKSDNE